MRVFLWDIDSVQVINQWGNVKVKRRVLSENKTPIDKAISHQLRAKVNVTQQTTSYTQEQCWLIQTLDKTSVDKSKYPITHSH